MCFGMDWLFHLLILLVFLCGFVAIMLILIPWALSYLGVAVGDPVMRILRIIVGMMILIFIIYLLWTAWDCFAGAGGSLMLSPRGR